MHDGPEPGPPVDRQTEPQAEHPYTDLLPELMQMLVYPGLHRLQNRGLRVGKVLRRLYMNQAKFIAVLENQITFQGLKPLVQRWLITHGQSFDPHRNQFLDLLVSSYELKLVGRG